MSIIENWEEQMYDSTFDTIYEALIEEYKRGDLTIEELDRNIAEQQILLNAFFEGETKSVYCNAVVDAHQFVRSLIIQGKLTVENQ